MTIKDTLRDALAWTLALPALPFLRFAAPRRAHLHTVRGLLDRNGVTVVHNHYYEPVFTGEDLIRDPDEPRALAGIDWNMPGQLAMLERFRFADELRALEGRTLAGRTFHYQNTMFGPGDAEALYAMIRVLKPARIIEIGSGQSTLVARFAIEDATREDRAYSCQHVCYEPFENPWLDSLGIDVRRERIERVDLAAFRALQPNDIVFIDSSHVMRPMGDVEFEYLHILPILPVGVVVHVHDIFSPRDYPREWLERDRRFWTEQYLLEAFLSFNDRFEIICALNDLMHRAPEAVAKSFPVLAERGALITVGSFWFRRTG
jgi:hypothetical protein